MSGHRVADLAWDEVRALLAGPRVAVLPIGAAAKEHGPHLPLSTDWLTAEALGARLAARAPVVVWPTLGYGHFPAFVDYPGSTSVDAATMEATVGALALDLERAGAPAVLALNTGISTIGPVEAGLARASVPTAAVHVYGSDHHRAARARLLTQPRGGHADEGETSVMLHLHPERVRLERAVAWVEPIGPGRWSPDDPESPRYSPSGVYGDPTRARADTGEALVASMLDELEGAVRALLGG